ncbi:YgaP family membrane protein [Kaarinaea lacus]
MTERWYRMIQGIYLLAALYIEHDMMVYGFMTLLSIETLTNLRLPVLVSQLRYGKLGIENGCHAPGSGFNVDSERLLRFVVVMFLLLSYVYFPEPIWFFPWFIAAMLLLAGITNICPMVMMFQYLGFR